MKSNCSINYHDTKIQWLRNMGDSPLVAQFYQQAHPLDPNAIKALCEAQISIKKENTDHYDESGEYMPLAHWGKEGWDMAKIEANSEPSDVWDHPKWGYLYRVATVKTGQGNQTTTETKLQILAGSRRRALKRKVTGESTGDDTSRPLALENRGASSGTAPEASADASPAEKTDDEKEKPPKKSKKADHKSSGSIGCQKFEVSSKNQKW